MTLNPDLEEIWIDQVRSFFGNEEEDGMDGRTISIFDVPKTLKAVKPEAYRPQLLAIGPYHHWRDDMYEMEQYKLRAARKAQSRFNSITFQELVQELEKVEYKLRSRYHKYLMMRGETLAWMMAIDGLFLLQFLRIYVNRNECVVANSTRMSFLVDSKGRKLGYDSVLKDIMMLENQIPLYVMKKIIKIQCAKHHEIIDERLPRMFRGVCNALTPIKLKEDCPLPYILKRAHLLDVLYHLMVPTSCQESQGEDGTASKYEVKYRNVEEKQGCFPIRNDDSSNDESNKVFKELWRKASGFVFFKKMKDGPLKVVNVFGEVIPRVASYTGLFSEKSGSGSSSKGNTTCDETKAPQVEEIMIPTATQLCSFGAEFRPSEDISTIRFDKETKTLYIPIVNLDVNSEVILRNLVAYEASAISGPLVLARYTELMNGIVDTAEDARILAKKGIIKSEFGYQEVADIWNGMSKSIRLTHVDFIDKTIGDVNKYYYRARNVRLFRTMKAYVYRSWRVLVFLATLIVIGLMCLQSFCSVYNCPRLFRLDY